MNLMERMEKKTSEKPLEKAQDNKVKQSEESKNDNAVFRSEQQNIKSGKNEYAEIIDETHKEVAAMLAKIDNVSSSDVETPITALPVLPFSFSFFFVHKALEVKQISMHNRCIFPFELRLIPLQKEC